MIKLAYLQDSTDHNYDWGLWEAPGDGWAIEQWHEAIRNAWFAIETFDSVVYELGGEIDESLDVPNWEDGLGPVLDWLYPELSGVVPTFARIVV